MTLLNTLKSRKALAGMVAVAAGTATVAAPVVALPLSAAPSGDTTAGPAVNGDDTGTYESCSALFGLTDKTNANYVTFNVAGTADPLPGIGQGLTPVITVTDPESGAVDECVPEIGFNDAESWFAFLDLDVQDEEDLELVGAVVPYPGTPGYLVPASRVVLTPVATGSPGSEPEPEPEPAPLSIALRIETESTVNPGYTVTWEPSELSFPELDFDDIYAIIVQELGGPTSPLGIRFTEYVIEPGGDCTEPPEQIDVDLADALIGLTGLPKSFFDALLATVSVDTCDLIQIAGTLRLFQLDVDSLGLPVSVTVNAPAPAPTPGPAPTPVTPRFTG